MLIGSRTASVPLQLAALAAGTVSGLALYVFVVTYNLAVLWRAGLTLLPDSVVVVALLLWLCVALSAYGLAAPATWRGLGRRATGLLATSLLLFAGLGYVYEFAGLPTVGGMPDQEPPVQAAVVLAGVLTATGSRLLRERPEVRPA